MIDVKGLKKSFEQGLVQALNGVSLSVKAGEIVSVMGPSGCGKSTLLKILGTLERRDEGEIWFNGKNIDTYQPYYQFRAHYLGFVFQFHHLIPSMTLWENVEIPLWSVAVTRKARREKAAHLLEKMGLSERMNFFPTRVSGGERQRAALARALVNDPKILLADEPTGSLDTVTGEEILDFLLHTCRARSITAIIATHNTEVAAKTDRIIRLRNGLLVQ
jgi:putative ABC transport system ATP-binding protein